MDRGSDKTMSKGTAFTRSRSYTYGSSSRPHAVTEVDNTGGRITLQVQDVGFNNWSRMSSVWATDENDFYSYSVDYGPDMRRASSEMHKTYNNIVSDSVMNNCFRNHFNKKVKQKWVDEKIARIMGFNGVPKGVAIIIKTERKYFF